MKLPDYGNLLEFRKKEALSLFSCIQKKSNKHLTVASPSDEGRGEQHVTVKTKPNKIASKETVYSALSISEKFAWTSKALI